MKFHLIFNDFLFHPTVPPYIFNKLPFDASVGYSVSIPVKNQFKFQGISLIQAYLLKRINDDEFRDKFSDVMSEVPDLTLFEEDLCLFQDIELLNLIIDDPNEFRQAVQKVYHRYLDTLKQKPRNNFK